MSIPHRTVSRTVTTIFRNNSTSSPFSGHVCRVVMLLVIMCMMFMPAMAPAQTQLGMDIDGVATYDQLRGVSLSANGNRLAVGADQYDSINGTDSGHVRIYEWMNSQWVQLGADINGETAHELFGDDVSLSADGNRVVIGARSNSESAEYAGQVRIYRWTGSDWTQMGEDINGGANDHFGVSVSISSDGDRVAAASQESSSAGESYGYVRIFQWSGTAWEQLGADINGKGTYDRLGSVSLSGAGDRVAFGAFGVAGNTGQVRVYEWSGTAWIQLGTDIDAEAAADGFGTSVSLSGDGTRLAAGGPANDGNGPWAGHTRVFQWTGSAWAQLGEDIDGDTRENWFGSSVSLSTHGNRLAVGAVSKFGDGDYTGLVRIYQWSGTNWFQIGNDIDGEADGDAFGKRVALSANGNRVAATADQNDANGNSSGHARVFDLGAYDVFQINPGLNDAWYYQPTSGQGFFITIFPDLGLVSTAWFTYDTEQPAQGATANLGDPGHRWLTALGPYAGDQAVLTITIATGGLFDTPVTEAEVTRVSDGTLTLTFDGCNSGTAAYNIPSVGASGSFPIERVATDNVPLCEAFLSEMSPW